MARRAQALHEPRHLPIERLQIAGPCIKNGDTHRGGVDQGLQVGPGSLLGAVRARVGDCGRGLRGE